MIALYIIAGILCLIFLLLMLRVRITVAYSKAPADEGKGAVYAGLGPVRIKLYPAKKKKLRLSDYSAKKYRQLLEEDALKKEKSAPKEKKKKEKLMPEGISETLEVIGELVERFSRHLRCEVLKIRLNIGTKDAAATALAYAGAASAVDLLLELLDRRTDMRLKSPRDVYVRADFESGTVHGDISVKFSIRVINVLRAGGGILKSYFKKMIRLDAKASKNNTNNSAAVRQNGDNYER